MQSSRGYHNRRRDSVAQYISRQSYAAHIHKNARQQSE
jgi:hypothetical protein